MKMLWISATLAVAALLCMRPAAAQIGIVSVTGGRVEGVTADGVTSFKGIPFAAPPVGALRWRAPQPVRPWSGIKKADHFGPSCMQDPSMLKVFGASPAMSEDCLYLNVWTPARSARTRLPVMVWIYGGALADGTTSDPAYEGARLAKRATVVVSIAYRVGALGFLADPELSAESPHHHLSGNYGVLDVIAALRWVKANIAKFGGEPSRVTIFGESAGGTTVGQMAQSPLARGLFQRAIAESGADSGLEEDALAAGDFVTLRQAQQAGQRFLAKLGATSIAAARALHAQAVVKAQGSARPAGSPAFTARVVKGAAFPGDGLRLYQVGRFNDTPLLLGSNADDGGLFVPAYTSPSQFEAYVRGQFGPLAAQVLAVYPHTTGSESSRAMADIVRDAYFAWGAWTWARLQSENGKGKAYLYYFDRRSPQALRGPIHTAEIGYVFGNLTAPGFEGLRDTPGAADLALSNLIQSYWVNFAKSGDPNGPGLPHWPAFSASSQRVMYLDARPHAGPVPNLEKLKVLDAYFTWARQRERSPAQTQH